MEREPYPSDSADEQWAVIEPMITAWKQDRVARSVTGDPGSCDLREIVNAIFYQCSTPNRTTSHVPSNLAADLRKGLTQTRVITTSDSALRSYFTVHRGDFRHQSFAAAREEVRQAYVMDRYQAVISRLTASAHVSVHHAVFDALPVS
jgi:hypothetical protein